MMMMTSGQHNENIITREILRQQDAEEEKTNPQQQSFSQYEFWVMLNKNNNNNNKTTKTWVSAHKLQHFVQLVIELNRKYNANEDIYVRQLTDCFEMFLTAPGHYPLQDRLVSFLNGEDGPRGKIFENELAFALHFCATLCLYLNRDLQLDHKPKILQLLQNDLNFYTLDMERRNNGRGFVLRTLYGMRDFAFMRLFNWLNYSTVHFLISVFGSRVGPKLFAKLLSEKSLQRILLVRGNMKTKKEKQLRAYSGFVFGTLLGALLSGIPLQLLHQTERALLPRRNAMESPIIQSAESTTSGSFWLVAGALAGMLVNFGFRYGAHKAVLLFLHSKFPATILSKHPMGSDPEMNKMILGAVSSMYKSYATSLLYPTVAIDNGKPTTNEKKKRKKSDSSMDISMFTSMMDLGRDSLLNQIPLYKNSRIAQLVIDHYLPKPKSKKAQETSKPTVVTKLADKVSQGYNWGQTQVAKVYPRDNSSWHSTSAGMALWLSNRYANPDLQKEQELFHQLHYFMKQVERHLIDNKSMHISSRL